MATCPLCSDVLLRHIRSGQTYWFCRSCRLEVLAQARPVQHLHRLPAQPESTAELSSAVPSYSKPL